MAVFEGQISAQVTKGQKDTLAGLLEQDRGIVVGTSEADVIRLALALGLAQLVRRPPEHRCRMYALVRRGLEPDPQDVMARPVSG